MKRILSLFAGIVCLLAGVAGLLIPAVPGWVLIFAGLCFIVPHRAARWRGFVSVKFFRRNTIHFHAWRKAGIEAGFTTRRFPLVFHKTDELEDPANQARLRERLPGSRFVFMNQVHGAHIAVLDEMPHAREVFHRLPETDAAITSVKGLTLLVFAADCLPVFYQAPGWVGLAHAGWRGTQAGIAEKTLRLIAEKSGCPPRRVKIAFGPAICGGHYEVGREFESYFRSVRRKDGKWYFDLPAENRRRLLRAGAGTKNILDLSFCTFAGARDFYSFRREKDRAGRMISFIRMIE